MDQESVLKKERVTYVSGFLGRYRKGDLTLTETRLTFTVPKGFRRPQDEVLFNIPIADILNARAKKAFSAGTDHLEIRYKSGGKERKIVFQRTSFVQWANALQGGHLGRLETNSMVGWEKVISDLKIEYLNPPSAGVERAPLEILKERLAKGEISIEEFRSVKMELES